VRRIDVHGYPPVEPEIAYHRRMLADQLIASLDSRDEAAFEAALNALGSSISRLEPAEVARNAEALAAQIPRLPIGIGSFVTRMIGGMCDYGADAAAVLPALVDGALRVLGNVTEFKTLCADSGLDLPDNGDEAAFPATMRALIAAAEGGREPRAIAELAESWFAGDGWIQPVLFLMQRKEVRAALPRRAELSAAIGIAAEDLSTAHWLHGLLLVLADEPLIVLHRASARGWRCTVSGVGDNFQLHTLLAGQFAETVGARPPTAIELAAASTGEPQPADGIMGAFNLVDALGAWIWNEGCPADIPHCEGTRVVVLDPPPYQRSWNAGRAYPLMVPSLTVDGPLSEDEAARWLSLIKPSGGPGA
jgi:hypothetical protein